MNCLYFNDVRCPYSSSSHCFECTFYELHQDGMTEEEKWDGAWTDEFTPRESIYDN